MSEMMDRIRDEMAREQVGSPVSVIGEYVTSRLEKGADIPEGKTLAGAYKAMEAWARKQHKSGGSCVCVPPDRAYAIVDEYFGFGKTQAIAPAAAPKEEYLDLDALLGG